MRVDDTVAIDAPPLDVFDTYVRVEHWPQWTETVNTVRRLDAGPIRIGVRTRIKQPKLREAGRMVQTEVANTVAEPPPVRPRLR